MVWLQTLSFSCSLESIQTISGHLLCLPSTISCHRNFGMNFREGARFPLPEYSSVVLEYCKRDVEESLEKRSLSPRHFFMKNFNLLIYKILMKMYIFAAFV